MSAGPGMFACVLVRRAVATMGQTAGLAGSEVNPVSTDLHAFDALAAFWMFYCRDRRDVSTNFAGKVHCSQILLNPTAPTELTLFPRQPQYRESTFSVA
jgi:hypothetical protein